MRMAMLGAVGALAMAAAADAAVVQFQLNSEFSGSGANPSGPAPWGSAWFEDTGANTVTLTLSRAATLGSGEFISSWLFNLNPSMNPAGLVVNQSMGPTSTNSVRGSDETDTAFRAGGGPFFDLKFQWPTGNVVNRFDSSWMTAVYTLTMAGLDASDFVSMGAGAGNSPNGLVHAAHIQGIGSGSAWVTQGPGPLVPLPPAAWAGLAGLGLVGLVGWRRRRAALPQI